MEFKALQKEALRTRQQYQELEAKVMGKPWSYYEQTQGLMVDAGELMELVMAKAGVRANKWENLDKSLELELSDILWSVFVIADQLNINLEESFLETINLLEKKIADDINEIKKEK